MVRIVSLGALVWIRTLRSPRNLLFQDAYVHMNIANPYMYNIYMYGIYASVSAMALINRAARHKYALAAVCCVCKMRTRRSTYYPPNVHAYAFRLWSVISRKCLRTEWGAQRRRCFTITGSCARARLGRIKDRLCAAAQTMRSRYTHGHFGWSN